MSLNNNEIIELRKRIIENEFNRMNDMQKKAVLSVNGQLLILAGAGSGKTTVIVNRIANILRFGEAMKAINSMEIILMRNVQKSSPPQEVKQAYLMNSLKNSPLAK